MTFEDIKALASELHIGLSKAVKKKSLRNFWQKPNETRIARKIAKTGRIRTRVGHAPCTRTQKTSMR